MLYAPSALLTAVSLCLLFATDARAAEAVESKDELAISETFVSDPLRHGWNVWGDTNLFRWDAASSRLEVTWDSSQSNSYLRLPLRTVLTRADDFEVALDLQLRDVVAGVNEDKPSTFQIAFGFQMKSDAEKPGFIRGAGDRSPNLVEFNFFPDTGFGPTVWPAAFSSAGRLSYTGSGDFSVFDLPLGIVMRVTLRYTGANETATVTITTNGIPVGPLTDAPLAPSFTGFELDTFAIASYSDDGQRPFMPGSILAHGAIGDIHVTVPPPPIRSEHGSLVEGRWQASFLSRVGWRYVLEGTSDLNTWTRVSSSAEGDGGPLLLTDDSTPLSSRRFFRIAATRFQ
ncbi:MAG: hypothetical protein HYR88_13900 [Verrucomicrobia bacterium]|nr:hypothetical protein [Verrucomicrobiota bacterium]MBI3869911.1 hypothetical protein [Verrucomicrobiota bacterium]